MPDYKEMYLHLFRETEKANSIQIEAQQQCEEMYISAPEHELRVLPKQDGDEARIRVVSTPDYKGMFQHLYQETHRAVLVLMDAQIECDRMSMNDTDLECMSSLLLKPGEMIPLEEDAQKNTQA